MVPTSHEAEKITSYPKSLFQNFTRSYPDCVITEYLCAAMREARYELMEDGNFFATISPCKGLWATGETLQTTQVVLREVLEDWIRIKSRHGDTLPMIAGVRCDP